ncbi:RNA polymerase sigma-70 factor, ECF subfamily [Verrucomicrobium sp. GAS474]|uniref:RNA polymerase sigma factor n=1 Tax=Verrucomicrobium sp. GAS474 TaxID=1882831 RepID=UPI0008796B02|nr:RNA polymerase sigma factor [Verrucomicrobium sp. GAS474]SDT90897.1 RNA polymerase sigma-70 factor, ECF subfamily [Verrucomicrobium sp. GAS474]
MAHPDPDLPLVEALQRGEVQALDALMERHREAVFRFVFRYVGNEADAREVAQDTFVRAYFSIGKFRPSALFSTWLFQIALNLCRDRVRTKAYRQTRQTDSLSRTPEEVEARGEHELPSSIPDPAVLAQQSEKMRALQDAINGLPHGLKAPFLLAVMEGLSQEEAGNRLGLTAKAIEVKVHRARKLLLKCLEKHF